MLTQMTFQDRAQLTDVFLPLEAEVAPAEEISAKDPLECEVCVWLRSDAERRNPPCAGRTHCPMKDLHAQWEF